MTRGGPHARRCISAVAVIALATGLAFAHADPALPALNSYGQPPFVPAAGKDGGSGLAATFVDLVNKALGGRPAFALENLPRKRLELTLGNQPFSGIALFLAPEFLAPAVQQDALWSEPVMVDENLVVTVYPLKFSSLEDLHGLKLGGISGHIYRSLGPAIEDGKVRREDAPDHISNLKKLCLGRVDFVVISRSELAGTIPHVSCAESFKPTAYPEPQVIVRRVLVRIPDDGDAREVLEAVAAVACGPQWGQALSKLGLSNVGCRNTVAKLGEPVKSRKTRPTTKLDG